MIIVSVHLKSAISRARDKELARFVICNDGLVDDPEHIPQPWDIPL